MEQSRTYLLQRFKRLGALYIMGCALVVTALVIFGVRQVQITTYGRMMASGLNGIGVASLGEGTGLDDSAVRADFQRNFKSLVAQGSFQCITLVTPDGEPLVATDVGACALLDEGLPKVESVLANNTIATSIVRGENRELLVVAPLRRTPQEDPYAVVIAARPYALVRTSLVGVSVSIAATILLGAIAAYTMLRIFIRRAEYEIDQQERLVHAIDRRLASALHEAEGQAVGTLKALVAAVDAKDSYTAQHSLNVADYACAIARDMGRNDYEVQLERAGLLHDIGKIGVPEHILAKPGRLDSEEMATVREHSSAGAEIVAAIPFLREAVPIIRHHHERVDGTGYPDGLAGSEIPLLARILGVADAFDAMTTDRPYQKAMPSNAALAVLIAGRGTQFDSAVVDSFVDGVTNERIRIRVAPERRDARGLMDVAVSR